ncbi:cupin domain-containing protein [Leucobacter sp. NPDC058333]|uniref:cupin domain-containing protein n=1 Tax=Leucobacter sp. NPDC058333 TaxID=3346450 RepID=UPI00364C0436
MLWTGSKGGRGVLVAGTDSPNVVELWDWTLGPAESHTSEPHSEGTRELLQILTGTVTIAVGNERFELDEGDALTFDGAVAHSYTNPAAQPARFTLTVFEPGVGTAHRTETTHA